MKPSIHSLHNSKIRSALQLRDGGHRKKTGRFLIDGARETFLAVASGFVIEQVFYCEESLREGDSNSAELQALIERIPDASLQPVSAGVLDKLSYGQRSSQIVCVGQTPAMELERLQFPDDPLVVVVDGIEKPGNVGAILRTADAACVTAVIFNNSVCEIFNPNAIRASLGTIFSVPIAVGQTRQTIELLERINCRVFATLVDADEVFWNADFRGPVAIVLGSEASGLGADWRETAGHSISIPMSGRADSLNISTSAAIVLYEMLRQRRR